MKCECMGCEEEAEYRDPMGNYVCPTHAEEEVEDDPTLTWDDFDGVAWI
ncbi:MAG: hypothetical protein GWN00_01050 [Aliifodinibius sp.]|nr:hypothetical protein [Fodinibius sp.]NIV09918.1 hypothetical protein [Fodinibius sp.]NIY23448.1 hypothetical protein [Fodinibius sp.]